MAKLYVKWEGMQEVNKPNLVIGVSRLILYLLALGKLTKKKLPHKERKQCRDMHWPNSRDTLKRLALDLCCGVKVE